MKTVQNLMEISKISFSIQNFYVLNTFFSYKHRWSQNSKLSRPSSTSRLGGKLIATKESKMSK